MYFDVHVFDIIIVIYSGCKILSWDFSLELYFSNWNTEKMPYLTGIVSFLELQYNVIT